MASSHLEIKRPHSRNRLEIGIVRQLVQNTPKSFHKNPAPIKEICVCSSALSHIQLHHGLSLMMMYSISSPLSSHASKKGQKSVMQQAAKSMVVHDRLRGKGDDDGARVGGGWLASNTPNWRFIFSLHLTTATSRHSIEQPKVVERMYSRV